MLLYSPALRSKNGEHCALARLPHQFQRHVWPRLILPPPEDSDPEKRRPLTKDEIASLTGERIAQFWPLHPAFLDPQFVLEDMRADDLLLRMFRGAQNGWRPVIPVATAEDLLSPIPFNRILAPGAVRLAVRVVIGDYDADAVSRAIEAVGLTYSDCVAIADFSMVDLRLEDAAAVVVGSLEDIDVLGSWQRIIFQGSTYPSSNPAAAGEQEFVRRHEWLAFKEALKECAVDQSRLVYGDYGADTSKIKFPKGAGGKTIRHLRYTTPDSWLVVRGEDTGAFGPTMASVAKSILDSGHFAGRGFSAADDRIFRMASEQGGPGNATTWRELNTSHHIIQVLRDLGRMHGIAFPQHSFEVDFVQTNLFE